MSCDGRWAVLSDAAEGERPELARLSGRLAVVPARAFDDRRCSRPALAVLGVLSTYADRDGWCWPRVSTLAERLELARSTVSGHLAGLVKLGYLEIRPRFAPDGRQLANAYRILYDAELPSDSDRQHPSAIVQAGPPPEGGGVSAQPTGGVGPDPTPPVGPDPTPRTTQENDVRALTRAHTRRRVSRHPKPPGGPAGELVEAAYLNGSPQRPPQRFLDRLAGEVDALLAEGFGVEVLGAALAVARQRGLHPSSLPSVVAQVLTAPPGQRRAASGLPGATPEQLRARAAQLRAAGQPPGPGPPAAQPRPDRPIPAAR